jgi:SsrA-binding protein
MDNELVGNRKAGYSYEILETFEAGIVLQGTEIKSLRDHGGSLAEAFVKVEGSELFIYGFNISAYKFGNIHNHEEKRVKKLLMHKREIASLRKAQSEKGLAIIPLSVFLKKGIAKVKIAIAKGKKNYDKREAIKERDEKRSIQRLYK